MQTFGHILDNKIVFYFYTMLSATELGMENVAILRKWEQLEKQIDNFKNHRRFTLRCLSHEDYYS